MPRNAERIACADANSIRVQRYSQHSDTLFKADSAMAIGVRAERQQADKNGLSARTRLAIARFSQLTYFLTFD